MTDGSPRVDATLSYDKARFTASYIPVGVGVGLLGLGLVYLVAQGVDPKPSERFAALLLAAGGFGAAVLAWWRSRNPGEPTLVLSTSGLRYRLASNLTLVVPWRDIAAVGTTDVRMTTSGVGWTRRGVPTVMVPDRYLPGSIKLDSWWLRERWRYTLAPKGGLVQVALHDDELGVTAEELFTALDQRWRAFSRRPEADAPPRPYPGRQRRLGGRVSRKVVWAAATLALLLALPLLWHWRKAYAWYAFPVPRDGNNAYLDMQLDGAGALARTPDGGIITVLRHHVAWTHGTECRKHIARDTAAKTRMPSYTVTATCLTDLDLTSGTQAVAVVQLEVKRFQTEYVLGKFRETAAIVTARLDKAEAQRLYCRMRMCAAAAPADGTR